MEYLPNEIDQAYFTPCLWTIREEKYGDSSKPKPYSYDYWLYSIAELLDFTKRESITANTSKAVLRFSCIYAVASSYSFGEAVKNDKNISTAEYKEDHGRFENVPLSLKKV